MIRNVDSYLHNCTKSWRRKTYVILSSWSWGESIKHNNSIGMYRPVWAPNILIGVWNIKADIPWQSEFLYWSAATMNYEEVFKNAYEEI